MLAGGRIGQGEGRARRKEIQENNGYRKNDRGRRHAMYWSREQMKYMKGEVRRRMKELRTREPG